MSPRDSAREFERGSVPLFVSRVIPSTAASYEMFIALNVQPPDSKVLINLPALGPTRTF